MPNLGLKVIVHNLAIGKGVSPKKQIQRCFRPQLMLQIEKG